MTVGTIVPADHAEGAPVSRGASLTRLGLVLAALGALALWRWSVALFVIFLLISIQFVSPTRRWHLRRRRVSVPGPKAV